jgi:hypothetical protein
LSSGFIRSRAAWAKSSRRSALAERENEVRSAEVGDSSIKRQTTIVKGLSKATVLPRWPDDV